MIVFTSGQLLAMVMIVVDAEQQQRTLHDKYSKSVH